MARPLMRSAYRFLPGQGINSLEEFPLIHREVKPHEVRIAVKAVSLNYRDVLIYKGQYPAPTDRPVVPCSDGAGVVLEVGSAVSNIFKPGDHVVGTFFSQWQDGPPSHEKVKLSFGCNFDGWLADEVIMPANSLVRIPKGISFASAACAPCAGVTAWVAIVELTRLSPGQTVLIQGTGGVSMWAIQLAKAMGLKTILVTSDEKKSALLCYENLDAINYRNCPDWSREVLRITNGYGADLVLELGGNSTIRESLRSLAFGGHVAIIGGLGGWSYDNVEYLELITKLATMHGIYVGSARSLTDLLDFSVKHSLEPYVSSHYEYRNAQSAFLALEARNHIGKIIIDVHSD